ncbi:MAG: hypothetical protein QW156_04420 [Candidatus Aenigmatarchaeota archaeon]
MEGWERYLNKTVAVYYDDGKAVSKKIGKLTHIDNDFLFLKTSDEEIAIPVDRVIRIELGGGKVVEY